jgi:hypothetical protein
VSAVLVLCVWSGAAAVFPNGAAYGQNAAPDSQAAEDASENQAQDQTPAVPSGSYAPSESPSGPPSGPPSGGSSFESPSSPASPSLVERYQRARMQMLAERLARSGLRPAPVQEPVWVSTPSDSLRPSKPAPAAAPPEETSFPVSSVRSLRKLERAWFEARFSDTRWSFLGAGRYFTPLDTTMTRELRARMQAHFGDPTQTLGDFDLRTSREEYVQFEYWLVVNDSIPVVVTDAGGPRDRGLIVATDARYRNDLFRLRQSVLGPIMQAGRAPYVDYYYEEETRRWYRTGYDGEAYFMERVYRSQMTPGRRPWLDPSRTQPPAPPGR